VGGVLVLIGVRMCMAAPGAPVPASVSGPGQAPPLHPEPEL
jgi:hypothetical protein